MQKGSQPERGGPRRRLTRARGVSCDDVHQSVGHHDHLAHLSPVERTLDFLRSERKRLELGIGQAPGDGQRVAQLALDLHRDSHFGLDQQGRIDRGPSGVGDQALATETLTLATPDTPRAAVDSRGGSGDIPDPDLHRTTIAAALAAKRPVVAVFATPVYCTSRFCGPVTDLVDELAHQYADRATFVHVEIWRDFQTTTVNKSAADWIYRNDQINEPWVFLIDANGRIVARYDNVATSEEIEPFLEALPTIGPAPA